MPSSLTTAGRKNIDQILLNSNLTPQNIRIIRQLIRRSIVETITASGSVYLDDSGKIFLLTNGTGSVINIFLPSITVDLVGVAYTFFIQTGSDDGFNILAAGGGTSDGNDLFTGHLLLSRAGTSEVTAPVSPAPASGDNTISLDSDLADSGGETGSIVKVTAIIAGDGDQSAGYWLCEGVVVTDATASPLAGAALLTNT